MSEPVVYFATVLGLGIASQWLAWRFRIPAIVLLLAFGFALGEVVRPDDVVKTDVLLALVSLSVGVILFEGGLSLRFREVRETHGVVLRLVTAGLLITWLLTTVACRWIIGLDLPIALLAGALLTVSGPTVIVPLLRHVRPVHRTAAMIKWEGIVNDPIGAVLAALVFHTVFLGDGSHVLGGTGRALLATAIVGTVLGLAAAVGLAALLRHYWVPDYLQSAVFLAVVVVVFMLANHIQTESGLITVTVMGVLLGNQKWVTVRHVARFKENLRVLLISTLFIVLSSRVDGRSLQSLGWRGPLFVAALLVIVRPVSVFMATLGADIQRNERWLLAWIHPRGIVAAAVSSLFALELSRQLSPDNPLLRQVELLVPLTFVTIASTVTVYGLTLGPLARWLGLSRQNPQGILFAGAGRMVREMALTLQVEGYETLLVDTNRRNVAAARMAGLPVCYAAIASEYTRNEVDLGGVGRLLAMTPNDEVNALAAMEFADEFSRAEVYQLSPDDRGGERKETVPAHRRGRILFGKDATYGRLEGRIARGAVLKKTTLSDDFSYDDFLAEYGQDSLLLFLIESSGRLLVCTADRTPAPRAGQKIVALVDPNGQSSDTAR